MRGSFSRELARANDSEVQRIYLKRLRRDLESASANIEEALRDANLVGLSHLYNQIEAARKALSLPFAEVRIRLGEEARAEEE